MKEQGAFIKIEGRTPRFSKIIVSILKIITLGLYNVLQINSLSFKLYVETKKCIVRNAPLVLVTNEHGVRQLVSVKSFYFPFSSRRLRRFLKNQRIYFFDAMFTRFFYDHAINQFVSYSYSVEKKDDTTLRNLILERMSYTDVSKKLLNDFLIKNKPLLSSRNAPTSDKFFGHLENIENFILFGRNCTAANPKSRLQIIASLVMCPLFLYTVFGIILWTYIDYRLYAGLIAVLTTFSLINEYIMEANKNSNVKALAQSKKYVLVFRKQQWQRIDSRDLFPGDLIVINPSQDFIADILLVSGEVVVDESFLTGETVPIIKNSTSGANIVYSGTKILQSTGGATNRFDIVNKSEDRIKCTNIRKTAARGISSKENFNRSPSVLADPKTRPGVQNIEMGYRENGNVLSHRSGPNLNISSSIDIHQVIEATKDVPLKEDSVDFLPLGSTDPNEINHHILLEGPSNQHIIHQTPHIQLDEQENYISLDSYSEIKNSNGFSLLEGGKQCENFGGFNFDESRSSTSIKPSTSSYGTGELLRIYPEHNSTDCNFHKGIPDQIIEKSTIFSNMTSLDSHLPENRFLGEKINTYKPKADGKIPNELNTLKDSNPLFKNTRNLNISPLSKTQFKLDSESFSKISTVKSSAQSDAIGLVISTGFGTAKGRLVRNIMLPKPIKFCFYDQSTHTMIVLSIIGALTALCMSIYFSRHINSRSDALWFSLDLILCILSPALPATIRIGCTLASKRLRKKNIVCYDSNKINLAGNTTMAIFDKTGTLTSEGLELLCLDNIENEFHKIHDVENLFREAISTCHSVNIIENEYVGDPLDVKMFLFSKSKIISGKKRMICLESLDEDIRANQNLTNTTLNIQIAEEVENGHLIMKHPNENHKDINSKDHSEDFTKNEKIDKINEIAISFDSENDDALQDNKNSNSTNQKFQGTNYDGHNMSNNLQTDRDLDGQYHQISTDPIVKKHRVHDEDSLVFVEAQSMDDLRDPQNAVEIERIFDFDNKLRRMSVIVKTNAPINLTFDHVANRIAKNHSSNLHFSDNIGDFGQRKNESFLKFGSTRRVLYVKGSPESLQPLFKDLPPSYEDVVKDYALDGYRIISMGYKILNESDDYKNISGSTMKRSGYTNDEYRPPCLRGNNDFRDCYSYQNPNNSHYRNDMGAQSNYRFRNMENLGGFKESMNNENSMVKFNLSDDIYDSSSSNSKSSSRDELEKDLEFLGFVIFSNRLKSETTPSLEALNSAGIRTVMATGDNILTAISVGRQSKMIDKYVPVIFPVLDEAPKSVYDANWLCLSDDDLIFDKIKLTLHKNEDRVSYDEFIVACEGRVYEYFRSESPEYFSFLQNKGVIFARMNPDQKRMLVEDFNSIGYATLFCGDGANDCGALTVADVGISLAENEASIASSFTSTKKDISSVVLLLLEGRSALVTSLCQFKFVFAASLLQFLCLFLLSIFLLFLSDGQTIFTDFLLIMVLAQCMSSFSPSRTLSQQLVHCELFDSQNFWCLFSLVMCACFSYLVCFCLFFEGGTFIDFFKNLSNNLEFSKNSKVGTCCFVINNAQITAVGLFLSQGPPHRQKRSSNAVFCLCSTFVMIANSVVFFSLFSELTFFAFIRNLLSLVQISFLEVFYLLAMILLNVIVLISVNRIARRKRTHIQEKLPEAD